MRRGPLSMCFASGGLAEFQRAREERQRAATSPFYDAAMAQRISALLGPGFQSAYDPRRKRYVHTDFPITLLGRYTFPKVEPDPIIYPYTKDRGETISDILKTEPDTVYNFGPKPTANVFAHEYRHRAGIHNEYTNRLYDALYADTPEDWSDAVESWQDWMQSQNSRDIVSKQDAEANLIERLQQQEKDLRRAEWDAAPEREKPEVSDPTFSGWLSHVFFGDRGAYARSAPAYYHQLVEKKARGGLASLAFR